MGGCLRWRWLRAELGLGVPGSAEPQLGVGRGEPPTFVSDLADKSVGVCDWGAFTHTSYHGRLWKACCRTGKKWAVGGLDGPKKDGIEVYR